MPSSARVHTTGPRGGREAAAKGERFRFGLRPGPLRQPPSVFFHKMKDLERAFLAIFLSSLCVNSF